MGLRFGVSGSGSRAYRGDMGFRYYTVWVQGVRFDGYRVSGIFLCLARGVRLSEELRGRTPSAAWLFSLGHFVGPCCPHFPICGCWLPGVQDLFTRMESISFWLEARFHSFWVSRMDIETQTKFVHYKVLRKQDIVYWDRAGDANRAIYPEPRLSFKPCGPSKKNMNA